MIRLKAFTAYAAGAAILFAAAVLVAGFMGNQLIRMAGTGLVFAAGTLAFFIVLLKKTPEQAGDASSTVLAVSGDDFCSRERIGCGPASGSA